MRVARERRASAGRRSLPLWGLFGAAGLSLMAALQADAVEWRRAGTAERAAQAQAQVAEPGTIAGMRAAVRPAAWHAKPDPDPAPAFDPFEIPRDDQTAPPAHEEAEPADASAAATPEREDAAGMSSAGRGGPAAGHDVESHATPQPVAEATAAPPGFDPFEHMNVETVETAADAERDAPSAADARPEASAAGQPTNANDAAGMRRGAGAPGAVGPRVADDAEDEFNVQEAFDEPRRGSVGPPVGQELEEAGEAVQEEIRRREQEGSAPPQGDGAIPPNPFRPEGAADAPERNRGGSAEEPGAEIEDGFDGDDLDEQFQTPGGFDIRPLSQQPPMTPEQEAQRREQLERERIQNDKTCEEFLAGVKADNIKTVSLDIRMHGEAGEDYPFECGLGAEMFRPRAWSQVTYMWKASGLCHKPLYFEQVQMERYGHSWGPILDPVVAGVHFFGTFPVLPYKMGLETPNECVYSLGYYRPGSCAPYMIGRVPFTWRAAAFEAAAWTGGAFAIP